MNTPALPWLTRSAELLRDLACRPYTLLFVLLALNAVARPYLGIAHDARLYSVQAVNAAEPGLYADDLFFRYGSQDGYSIFSPVMGPLTALLGVHLAFFLVYVAVNVFLFWAMKRLVEQLVDDRAVSTLALMCMAVMPLNYAGQSIFQIHEPFLTSRLPSVALTALALSFVLESRYVAALGPLVVAGLLHPLMALGGVLVWGSCLVYEKLGGRWLAWLVALAGCATIVILATPSVAYALFGAMDEEWREAVRRATPQNFPGEWMLGDWLNLALGGIGVGHLAVKACRGRSRQACFFCAVATIGVLAVVGSVIVVYLPYALPFQGQPYRALWIVRLVQVPGCLALAAALWQSGRFVPGCLGVLTVTIMVLPHQIALQWLFPLLLLPLALLANRGLEERPRHPAWALRGVAWALLLGMVGWGLYRGFLLFANYDLLLARIDTLSIWPCVLTSLGTPALLVLCVMVLGTFRKGRLDPILGPTALALLVCVEIGFGGLPRLEYVQQHHSRFMPDVLFARGYLQKVGSPAASQLPTVYCSLGKVEYVWVELRAKCYFDWWQTSGFIFRRPTAVEGERRAAIVAPFEMQRFRAERDLLGTKARADIEKLLRLQIDGPPPTLDDLQRLCAEPELDYVILPDRFSGLYAASNDRVYIYDCRQLRALFEAQQASTGTVANAP